MSKVRTLRNAIRAAITALPELAVQIAEGRIRLEDAPTVEHAWEAALDKPTIVIVYAGKRKEGGKLSTRKNEDFIFLWYLVSIADSYQKEETPDAVYEAEEIAEKVLDLREVKLATMGGESVYIAYASETQAVPPNRPLEGGRAAVIQSWESTKVRV